MTASSPIIGREELRRFPFRKRPVAQPGTVLVFQTRNGRLVSPADPPVSGDVTLGGYQYAYTVDITPHVASFEYQAPSSDTSLKFDLRVTYSWRVTSPTTVVERKIENPASLCEQHLSRLLRPLCREVDIDDDARAEVAIMHALPVGTKIPLTDAGITISEIFVEVRADALVVEGGRTRRSQKQDMDLRATRVQFFDDLVKKNGGAAVILGEDPSKTQEAYEFIDAQLRRDRQATLEAMKIVLETGHLAPGELDPAVQAIVENFTRMMDQHTTDGVRSISSASVDRPQLPRQAEPTTDEVPQ